MMRLALAFVAGAGAGAVEGEEYQSHWPRDAAWEG